MEGGVENGEGKNEALEEALLSEVTPIRGERCTLTEMNESYLPALVDYLNDPEINRYLRIRPPVTLEGQRAWLRACKQSGKDKVLAVLASFSKDEPLEFVGVVGLHGVDVVDNTAQGGAIIGNKAYQGRGIGKEARLLQLKYAFEDLKLRWVWGSAIGFNVRSQHLMEGTGYVKLGVRPGSRFAEGAFHDEVLYGVTKKTWKPFWDAYKKERHKQT